MASSDSILKSLKSCRKKQPTLDLETVWGLHGVRLVRILQNFDERTVSLINSREGEYVFKTAPSWKNRRGVKKDTDVFDALAKKGFCHAPKLIKTKRDTTFLQKGKKFFYLLEYVDGQSPKRTAATYTALGRIAAELHSVKRFPFHGDFDPAKILIDLRRESYKYSFGEEYRTIIRQLPNFSKLKQSLIHTDIAPSNSILRRDSPGVSPREEEYPESFHPCRMGKWSIRNNPTQSITANIIWSFRQNTVGTFSTTGCLPS